MRIFATSDLHTDFEVNRQIVAAIPRGEYGQDALIVAGDIAHRMEILEDTLAVLLERFGEVFFVPGNHDLWVEDEERNSIQKFYQILELCDRLGVGIRPAVAGDYRVVPLFSWYESSFDEAAESGANALLTWADFRRCRWPEGSDAACHFLTGLNESHLEDPSGSGAVVTFSHFVPRRDLLPPVHGLKYKGLLRVAGSTTIERQLRRTGSHIHIFGHSHIHCDREIDSVRYVQQGLGYPRERERQGGREFSLKRIA